MASSDPGLTQPLAPLRASACSVAVCSVVGKMALQRSVQTTFVKNHATECSCKHLLGPLNGSPGAINWLKLGGDPQGIWWGSGGDPGGSGGIRASSLQCQNPRALKKP